MPSKFSTMDGENYFQTITRGNCMKISRIVLSACILICAFICVSFVQEPGAMAKSPPPVPTTVVISPKSAAVAWGKEVQFTATVYDSNNKKITGLKLDWTLNDTVSAGGAPCSINKNGVLTVPNSTSDDTITISNFVNVAVVGYPAISAQADVTILGQPFAGGVFIGTHECTNECTDGPDQGSLAVHATATTFHALILNGDGNPFQEFSGTIDKTGNVSAAFTSDGHHVLISGVITATGLSGTWTQPDESGTWSVSETAVVGAGPKIGHWYTPGQKESSGWLAVIFNPDNSLSGLADSSQNGQPAGTPFSGMWTSDDISFTINNGGTATGGTGTYNPAKKTGSGDLLNGNTKVGTWSISDL
jgi:hypothetical protein